MNPSATGWIKKLLSKAEQNEHLLSSSIDELYFGFRSCGFIYGSNQSVVNNYIVDSDITKEEICKINMVLALFATHNCEKSQEPFTESVIDFYKEINEHKSSFFSDILNGRKSNTLLEKIIHKRIQLDDNFITKNFNYFITNALLFVDVLAYRQYLNTKYLTEGYVKQMEATIETVTFNVLNSKKYKTKYDKSLIRLLESSLRYQHYASITYEQAIGFIHNSLEAQYILDIACMATWSDETIDSNEHQFLMKLGKDIGMDLQAINQSLKAVDQFFTSNKKNIALLSSKNLVKSFYDNSSTMVSKLISRNSKRLLKELNESKELMVLLTRSTVKELSEAEQKKVQDQLLDIFKTIPSLAIFMLPGGALLLPLVVKFIPKLLPSAFDDNRIDET